MSVTGSSKPVLNALVRDVRSIATILRAIAFTSLCQVTISERGIQVITEVNGVLQAIAYLASGLFSDYTFNAPAEDTDETLDDTDTDIPTSVFEVSLSDLLVCMNIYSNAGASASAKSRDNEDEGARRREVLRRAEGEGRSVKTEMRIIYEGSGSPLILELQEGKTQTRCELVTFIENTTMVTDMPFQSDDVIGQVIMASKDLTEALQSIDTSTQEVSISFMDAYDRRSNGLDKRGNRRAGSLSNSAYDQQANRGSSSVIFSNNEQDDEDDDEMQSRRQETIQMMQIKAEGDTGSIELDFPNQFKVFEKFSTIRDSCSTYQFASIQRCLKALQSSLKASLRIDETGMLSLQCVFPKRIDQGQFYNGAQVDPENHGFAEIRITPLAREDDE